MGKIINFSDHVKPVDGKVPQKNWKTSTSLKEDVLMTKLLEVLESKKNSNEPQAKDSLYRRMMKVFASDPFSSKM